MATPSIVARGKLFGPETYKKIRFRGKLLTKVTFPDDGQIRRVKDVRIGR